MKHIDILNTLNYRIKRLTSFKETISYVESNNNSIKNEIENKEEELKTIQQSGIYYKKSQDILYEKSIGALKELINSALKFIFYDKNYEIIINLEDKRGTKNLSFGLKDLDNEFEVNLKNGCGNGIRSVVSAILNLFVILSKDSNILILDEKYSYLSSDYIEPFFIFLSKMCIERNLRIVIITHDPRFMDFADQVYNVSDGRVTISTSDKEVVI